MEPSNSAAPCGSPLLAAACELAAVSPLAFTLAAALPTSVPGSCFVDTARAGVGGGDVVDDAGVDVAGAWFGVAGGAAHVAGAVGCCEVAVAATGVAAAVHVDGGWEGVAGGCWCDAVAHVDVAVGCCEVAVAATGVAAAVHVGGWEGVAGGCWCDAVAHVDVAVGCCEVAVAATGVAAVVHVDGGWAGVVGGGCCEVTVSAAGDVGVGGGCCGVTTAWEETEHGTGDGYSWESPSWLSGNNGPGDWMVIGLDDGVWMSSVVGAGDDRVAGCTGYMTVEGNDAWLGWASNAGRTGLAMFAGELKASLLAWWRQCGEVRGPKLLGNWFLQGSRSVAASRLK